MNINECGCRPHEWLGLDGDRCIRVIPRQRKGAILIVFTVYVDTVNTNKIPYSIHNNIALILCVDHLDMPFNVHTTDKVTMMTMSNFLTI